MLASWRLTCDGFEFDLEVEYDAYIRLNADTPIDDKGYQKALRKMLKILPYARAVSLFDSMGEQAGFEGVLMTIEAYEKRLLPVSLETYQEAIAIRNRTPRPSRPAAKTVKPSKEGYVYLIKSPSGHYKIGKTIDPNDRMRTFTVKLPFEVEMIHTIKSNQYHALEKFLHAKFDDKRVNGEWFALSEEDIEYIKSLGVAA